MTLTMDAYAFWGLLVVIFFLGLIIGKQLKVETIHLCKDCVKPIPKAEATERC